MRRAWFGIALCLLAGCTNGPPPREQAPMEPIATAALQRDIDVLEQALRLHPGVYRYNTPAELQARLAALRRELGHDATLPEAYLAFTRFTAALRCGHTYLNPVNQSDAVAARLFSGPRVPFHFRWIDGRMVVLRNFSGDARLAPGAQVLAVDDTDSASLLARMLPLVRSDGHNDDKRVSMLEVAGRERYEAFDVLLPLLQPLGPRLRLRVLPAGAQAAVDLEVAASTVAERKAQRPAEAKGGTGWSVRDAGDGVLVLDMPSWALYDGKVDWHAWLDDFFRDPKLASARALVVDLRENEGGSDVGDELLAHFIDAEVPLPGYQRRVRYRATPVELRPFLDTWDPSFHDWGEQAQPIGEGWYRLDRDGVDAAGERIAPVPPRFAGRVFVLTSAVNSSATFEFARAMRRAGAGTLVGQSTGGNLRGINGGAFFFLNLPNSRLEVDLPLIGQFPLEAQPDGGLAPDIAVSPSAAAIATARDAELEAVMAALARE
jgi:hypothetical protein